MRRLAVWCIRLYQRWLSPRKGFQCAYRILTERDSCSAFALMAIGRVGMFAGTRLIGRRFRKCAEAHRRHLEEGILGYRASTGRPLYQSGHCDVPVGDCADGHECGSSVGSSVGDCLSSGCGWEFPSWRRRKREKEGEV
jgi:uncharacterized protein